jgi:hypothetical protein
MVTRWNAILDASYNHGKSEYKWEQGLTGVICSEER